MRQAPLGPLKAPPHLQKRSQSPFNDHSLRSSSHTKRNSTTRSGSTTRSPSSATPSSATSTRASSLTRSASSTRQSPSMMQAGSMLGRAGSSVMSTPTLLRPGSSASRHSRPSTAGGDSDEDFDAASFRNHIRAEIKRGKSFQEPAPAARRPSKRHSRNAHQRVEELQTGSSKILGDDEELDMDRIEEEYDEKARLGARALSSACWEDLISFLELNNISGAYALVLSANGVGDLTQLLSLDDANLGRVLEACNIDAMDEILLLEAIKSAQGR